MYAMSVLSGGRSARLRKRPRRSTIASSPLPSKTSNFQKWNAQCSVNVTIPHRSPLCMNPGRLHFSASSTSGTAA